MCGQGKKGKNPKQAAFTCKKIQPWETPKDKVTGRGWNRERRGWVVQFWAQQAKAVPTGQLGDINSFISRGSSVLPYTERVVREILPQCPPCCATRCDSARSGNHNQLQAQKTGIKPHCFNCCLNNGGIWCSHLQAAPLLWQCCTTPSVQVGESRGSSFSVPQPQEQEEAWAKLSKVRASHLTLIKPCFQHNLFLKVSC